MRKKDGVEMFHDPIGAFRRKADYKHGKNIIRLPRQHLYITLQTVKGNTIKVGVSL